MSRLCNSLNVSMAWISVKLVVRRSMCVMSYMALVVGWLVGSV